MKRNYIATLGTAAAIWLIATLALSQSTDPWIGTWKLNVAKSTFSPGPPPGSNTVKIEVVAGGGQKQTFDGINAQGRPFHSERVTKFDGADVRLEAVSPPSNPCQQMPSEG